MPQTDEQPTAAAFARVEEQLKNVQMDLAEIKTTLHESLSLNTAAHDAFWRAITEETRQRIEADMTLTLQCRALESEVKAAIAERKAAVAAEGEARKAAVAAEEDARKAEMDALRSQFRWVGAAVAVAWAVFQVLVNYGLRLAGR